MQTAPENKNKSSWFTGELVQELKNTASKPTKVAEATMLVGFAVTWSAAFVLSSGIWAMPLFCGALGMLGGLGVLQNAHRLFKSAALESINASAGQPRGKVAMTAAALYAVLPLSLGLFAGKSMLDAEMARDAAERAEVAAPRETATISCRLSEKERAELTKAFEEARQARAKNPAKPKSVLVAVPVEGCTL